MSVEEILAARGVSWPLTVPMCAPVGDGAAGAVLCSSDFLKKVKDARPVKILASVLGSGTDRGMDEEKMDEKMAERFLDRMQEDEKELLKKVIRQQVPEKKKNSKNPI